MTMPELLKRIAYCVEFGKINRNSTYPSDMIGQYGADELTNLALDTGIPPQDVLSKGLIIGMQNIGIKFRENKVFVPEVLMSAKAMTAAMNHLKPYFKSGDVKRKGKFVIGTVQGDLHDIGKKIVAMMLEGAGWEIIDLGANVTTEKFLDAVRQNPGCAVGLSALLTTTMVNMEGTVSKIKEKHSDTKVIIGGAPVNQKFCDSIGADFYSPDPQGAVEYLDLMNKI